MKKNLCIVVYDDGHGLCVPFVMKDDGSVAGWSKGERVAVFRDRESAKRAIRISVARAKYNDARDEPVNIDFTAGRRYIKVIPVAMVGGGK